MSEAALGPAFVAAAAQAKTFTKASNEDLLALYKFYKQARLSTRPLTCARPPHPAPLPQATVGDVNTPAPGMFDFKGKAKWDAWSSVKGTPAADAAAAYVALVAKLAGEGK